MIKTETQKASFQKEHLTGRLHNCAIAIVMDRERIKEIFFDFNLLMNEEIIYLKGFDNVKIDKNCIQ